MGPSSSARSSPSTRRIPTRARATAPARQFARADRAPSPVAHAAHEVHRRGERQVRGGVQPTGAVPLRAQRKARCRRRDKLEVSHLRRPFPLRIDRHTERTRHVRDAAGRSGRRWECELRDSGRSVGNDLRRWKLQRESAAGSSNVGIYAGDSLAPSRSHLIGHSGGKDTPSSSVVVGCSQNSLTWAKATLRWECPQVKRGITHSRSEALFRGLSLQIRTATMTAT
jgi:hypothetical protein